MEKVNRQLSQMVKNNITNNVTNGDCDPPDRKQLKEHSIASLLFLPKTNNLILIMMKYQTDSNRGTFNKIIAQNLQKSQDHKSLHGGIVHTEGYKGDVKTRCRGRFCIFCSNIYYGASGKTWRQCEDQTMVAMYQCSFSPAGGWIVVMESGVVIYRKHTVFKDAQALGQRLNSGKEQSFCCTSNFLQVCGCFQLLRKKKRRRGGREKRGRKKGGRK